MLLAAVVFVSWHSAKSPDTGKMTTKPDTISKRDLPRNADSEEHLEEVVPSLRKSAK